MKSRRIKRKFLNPKTCIGENTIETIHRLISNNSVQGQIIPLSLYYVIGCLEYYQLLPFCLGDNFWLKYWRNENSFSAQAFVIIFISLSDLRLQSGNIFYSQTFSSHRFQIIFSFPLFEAAIFWTITSANIKISRLFRKPPFYSYIIICIHDSKPFAVSSTFPALPISFSIFLPRESPSLSLFHLRRGRILWFKL